jgi:PIN domain nuclease of toxin-antitoxin system
MASVVFDASAVIALLIGEAGAESVAPYIGDGLISAVNLQEVIKALLRRGISLDIAREMIGELHLDIRPHARDEAFAAAALYLVTRDFGSGIGDRTCMALAIAEHLPALTADRAWARIKAPGLEVLLVR